MSKEITEKLINDFETMSNEEYIKLYNLAKSRSEGSNKMTIKELYRQGKFPYTKMTVTKKLVDLAEEFDAPMKCNISNIRIENKEEDTYILYLDFAPYEIFNKTVAVPSFWDENRKPTLTWFESGYYKDGKVEVYVQSTDNFEDFFEKKTVDDLRNEFSACQLDWVSKDGLGNLVYPRGYVEWLEKKILEY